MDQEAKEEKGATKDQHHLDVQVVTTSGTFPEDGFDRVSASQPVRVELDKAKKKLEITDTTGWIVTAGGSAVDPEKSYEANGLKGEVKLDWGPKEGGGGAGRLGA